MRHEDENNDSDNPLDETRRKCSFDEHFVNHTEVKNDASITEMFS